MRDIEQVLFYAGLGLLAWTGLLSWFGWLPGDIRIDGSVKVCIPVTSMMLLSLVMTLVLSVFRR